MTRILIDDQQSVATLDHAEIERSARRICEVLGRPDAEVSILLVDDSEIRRLNARYLARDCPTNVIAFPMQAGSFVELNPALLGDVVISVETASRQAAQAGHDLSFMIDFLLVHGILHLFGFDHEGSDEGARDMETRQEEIMSLIRRPG